MNEFVGALNFVLGSVYLQYGTMTLVEMRRNWDRMGFSHFGAAWVAMAFTCGPHHLVHGVHALFEGQAGSSLDMVAVLVGFPAGVGWFLLRVEAFRGGRGDRFVAGTPWPLMLVPTLAGVYLGAMVTIMAGGSALDAGRVPGAFPNVLLVGIYSLIGYYLLRTQLANRRPLGGWSISGLALTVIFPTCAVMHAVYAYYTLTGSYYLDTHMGVVDWLAVPAGLYFLWVVQALYRGSFRDWNSSGRQVAAVPPAKPARPRVLAG
ncbi:MAG TPA: hypothetical protein VGF21_15065 [Thermoleophilaceae bacterium]|jgi:hypothetical protein